jgi:hypothetical protein
MEVRKPCRWTAVAAALAFAAGFLLNVVSVENLLGSQSDASDRLRTPDMLSDTLSGSRSGGQSVFLTGSRSGIQFGSMSGSRSGVQSGSMSGSRSGAQPGSLSGSRSGAQPGSLSGSLLGSQSAPSVPGFDVANGSDADTTTVSRMRVSDR